MFGSRVTSVLRGFVPRCKIITRSNKPTLRSVHQWTGGTEPVSQLKLLGQSKMHGGYVTRYQHQSHETMSPMTFSVFMPPSTKKPLPVLYWLSGLTCDETNFMFKAGAQKYLAQHGIMVVCPDTSPRGLNIPGEDDFYDFGTGAGFYVNATSEDYSYHYNMYNYCVHELPKIIEDEFGCDPDLRSIFGHSMGGLGALNIALKNPNRYQSVSAFSPICNPTNCDWGKKAFEGYFNDPIEEGKQYDPVSLMNELITEGKDLPQMLISQGTEDEFLTSGQLRTQTLPQHDSIILNMEDGYDHSYYFIASFMEQHIDYHAQFLK